MVLALGGADRDAVRGRQHVVSAGTWDDTAILGRHGQEVEQTLGADDGVLTLDGRAFPKQGREAVGVKRQYCGELGKRANGQAGVFLGYASRHGDTLLDRRLSLPEEWVADAAYAARREACGVPAGTSFQTETALGAALLRAVRQAGTLRCRWVACDEGFGRDTGLPDAIAARGLWYYAEVPHDTRVWRDRPATAVPAWSGRGRKPTREQLRAPAAAPQTVAEVAAALPARAWSRRCKGREQRPHHGRLRPGPRGRGAGRVAGAGGLAGAAAQHGDGRVAGRPHHRRRRNTAGRAGPPQRDALADRALLRGGQAAPRVGRLRGALVARLASPSHPRHPGPLLPHAASVPVGGKRLPRSPCPKSTCC